MKESYDGIVQWYNGTVHKSNFKDKNNIKKNYRHSSYNKALSTIHKRKLVRAQFIKESF